MYYAKDLCLLISITIAYLLLLPFKVSAESLRLSQQTYRRLQLGDQYIQVLLVRNDLPEKETTVVNAFMQASERWSRVITTRNTPITVQNSGTFNICGTQVTFQAGDTIDNLLIIASIEFIDGSGSILGSAAPCMPAFGLPRIGVMRFDSADIANLIDNDTFDAVIEHEMGHVIGIGSLWDREDLVIRPGSFDPEYSGSNGVQGFEELGGMGLPNVENTGGQGTRDSHWRQSTFGNELMTGFLTGERQPLSIMTARSLVDLGYSVDESMSDLYQIPGVPLPDADTGSFIFEIKQVKTSF